MKLKIYLFFYHSFLGDIYKHGFKNWLSVRLYNAALKLAGNKEQLLINQIFIGGN